MPDQPKTTEHRRWLNEAQALITRCVPDADPARADIAAHVIADQLDMVWRGTPRIDFTKWRGALEPCREEETW